MIAAADINASVTADGYFSSFANWTPAMAERLAAEEGWGRLTFGHWKVIEFLRWYYGKHGRGPCAVHVHRDTQYSSEEIRRLFPCGMVRDAYRLAGLPRPAGCV